MVRWCVLVWDLWRRRCLISIPLPLLSTRNSALHLLTTCCVRLRRVPQGLGFARRI